MEEKLKLLIELLQDSGIDFDAYSPIYDEEGEIQAIMIGKEDYIQYLLRSMPITQTDEKDEDESLH